MSVGVPPVGHSRPVDGLEAPTPKAHSPKAREASWGSQRPDLLDRFSPEHAFGCRRHAAVPASSLALELPAGLHSARPRTPRSGAGTAAVVPLPFVITLPIGCSFRPPLRRSKGCE